MNILSQAKDLCLEHDVKLLYLSVFGSHLYGTDGPDSDKDYKGIFLPSKKRCFLGQNIKSITRNTSDSNRKNSKEDIDLQLWSLQYFLEMVSKGETNSLDLLYSASYKDIVLFEDVRMLKIFNNYKKLFDIKNCNAYVGYAIGQAKKYGIKGSRLGVLKNIYNWCEDYFEDEDDLFETQRLSSVMYDIEEEFSDPSYCFVKNFNGIPGLVICGKVHLATITINEFKDRIYTDYEKYGDRARAAEKSEGIDWKAISHAVRSLIQMESLIQTGAIRYPLEEAEMIKSVKTGQMDFPSVEEYISEKIYEIDEQLKNLTKPINIRDNELIETIILNFYGGII